MGELMDCSEPGESRISLAERRQHDAAALKGSSIPLCEFQKFNFLTRLTEPFLDKRKGQIGGKGIILGCIPVARQVVDLCSGLVQQIVVGNHKSGYNKIHRNKSAFGRGRFWDAVSSQGMRTLSATQDCRRCILFLKRGSFEEDSHAGRSFAPLPPAGRREDAVPFREIRSLNCDRIPRHVTNSSHCSKRSADLVPVAVLCELLRDANSCQPGCIEWNGPFISDV